MPKVSKVSVAFLWLEPLGDGSRPLLFPTAPDNRVESLHQVFTGPVQHFICGGANSKLVAGDSFLWTDLVARNTPVSIAQIINGL